MWEKILNKTSFNDKDIAFVIKNKKDAPKELLVRLGLIADSTPETIEVVEDAPKRSGRRAK